MTKRRMISVSVAACMAAFLYFGWKLTARGAYESAEYKVVEADGPFEIREYPSLMMATTNTTAEAKGGDGGFMRLFRYISGANSDESKIAMTTPVFTRPVAGEKAGQMGFVLPQHLAETTIPAPSSSRVQIRERSGGRFAVLRFAGQLDGASFAQAEQRLRSWMADKGLAGEDSAESAGYDPPWTPGPLRRNEVLIRLR